MVPQPRGPGNVREGGQDSNKREKMSASRIRDTKSTYRTGERQVDLTDMPVMLRGLTVDLSLNFDVVDQAQNMQNKPPLVMGMEWLRNYFGLGGFPYKACYPHLRYKIKEIRLV